MEDARLVFDNLFGRLFDTSSKHPSVDGDVLNERQTSLHGMLSVDTRR